VIEREFPNRLEEDGFYALWVGLVFGTDLI
jgi:hypothetical protein